MTVRDLLILVGSLALGLGLCRWSRFPAGSGIFLSFGMICGLAYAYPLILVARRQLPGQGTRFTVGMGLGLATASLWLAFQMFVLGLYLLGQFDSRCDPMTRLFASAIALHCLIGGQLIVDMVGYSVLLDRLFESSQPCFTWISSLGRALPVIATFTPVVAYLAHKVF